MLDTATPDHPGTPDLDQPVLRWRNLWFLSGPADMAWGENSCPSRGEAEQVAQTDSAGLAVFLAVNNDAFCAEPYEWVLTSRCRFAITLPCPAIT